LLVFLLVLLLPCLDPGCCAKIIVKQFDFWYILWSMALWTGTPIWKHRAHITSVIFTPSSVISLFCLIPDIVLAFWRFVFRFLFPSFPYFFLLLCPFHDPVETWNKNATQFRQKNPLRFSWSWCQ
jgi:hypothetical protein